MTIPNVVMNWCRKEARCHWDSCKLGGTIAIAQPMVMVMFWNKGKENSRRWNTKYYYHPQCWVEQGLDYLNRNPYVSYIRGRKCTLSKEDGRKRFLLVRRFNRLVQRKATITQDYPESSLIEANLTKQMLDIMLDVAVLGGVPKNWLEKIGV